MNNIFFTSDTHFCHNKAFCYEPRGFSSIEEMNETIIQNWNEIIHPNDTVYHLGDMVMNDTDAALPLLKRLNGNIIWILGNHDGSVKREQILSACSNIHLLGKPDSSYATILKDGKWHFYLCHFPTNVGSAEETKHKKMFCLCGHMHTTDRWADIQNKCYHAELDAHNNYPVSLEEVKMELRDYFST